MTAMSYMSGSQSGSTPNWLESRTAYESFSRPVSLPECCRRI
jgi:hypothetical protein